jgi:hypothetical protein
VQKQVDEANRLVAAMKQSTQDPAPAPAPASNEPAPAPTDQAVQAPAPAPAAVAPAPAPAPAQPTEDWEHKFKVLQGKYNAEVPRLHRELSETRQERDHFRGLVATLSTPKEPTAPAAPAAKVKPEEISEWGTDLYEFVKKAAAEVVTPQVDEVRQEVRNQYGKVEQSVSTVKQTVAQSARDRLFAELSAQVPSWQAMDTDEGFNRWLDVEDVFTGQPRRKLLNAAYVANDAPRVIAFFKTYLNENAAVSPRPSPAAPAPAAVAPQMRLEDMVAPGTPKAGAAGAPNGGEKRIWSQAEIDAHFRAVQRGTFRGRPAEQRAIELDIVAAGREGRLRP